LFKPARLLPRSLRAGPRAVLAASGGADAGGMARSPRPAWSRLGRGYAGTDDEDGPGGHPCRSRCFRCCLGRTGGSRHQR